MGLEITTYETPMAAQVADLFHRVYGVAPEEFAVRFDRFYEHPYQRGRCLRVVALDGDQVAGFAGFCVWPYELDGRRFDSFQCVDVVLDVRYRGGGRLQRMLDLAGERLEIDWFVAFPTAAATRSFLRNGWKHVLDLQWYVKPLNPLAFLLRERLAAVLTGEFAAEPGPRSRLRLSTDPEFRQWRGHYTQRQDYLFHGGFELKLIRRHRLLRELIIGDVRCEDADFGGLAKLARRGGATYLSIAANPLDPLVPRLEHAGFRKLDRRISFVAKPFAHTELVTDASVWTLYRSDLDTW